MHSYQELDVYQRSIDFVVKIYETTKLFPKPETYGLVDQLRRAVVSIPSNIAEGFDRRSSKEYLQFLQIAYGSSAEVETQLLISSRLNYTNQMDFRKLNDDKLILAIRSNS